MAPDSAFETGEVETSPGGGKHSRITTAPRLLPPIAQLVKGAVLKDAAERYERDNWRKIPAGDHLDHALKHIFEHLATGDPQDIVHAACRLDMVVELMQPKRAGGSPPPGEPL